MKTTTSTQILSDHRHTYSTHIKWAYDTLKNKVEQSRGGTPIEKDVENEIDDILMRMDVLRNKLGLLPGGDFRFQEKDFDLFKPKGLSR